MRLCKLLLLSVFFLPGVLLQARPHVYADDDELFPEIEQKEKTEWVEIYGDGAFSWGEIKDKNSDILSERMSGFRAGVRLKVGYNFMLGVEGEELRATDQRTSAISRFKRKDWMATVKWTLTPETTFGLYLLAGFGKVTQRAHLALMSKDQFRGDTNLWMGGIGGEIHIWKGLYVAGEYRIMYDTKKWDTFVFTGPRSRRELSAGVRYFF